MVPMPAAGENWPSFRGPNATGIADGLSIATSWDRVRSVNPVGRIFYSASTTICTPASKSQEVGLALGAQAGEARMREVVTSGGFRRFRRAAETPFNLIFEARP